ncbi:MAG: glycosyltransferase [Cytophagales bacterium]|nr:glycosyltransferase [Cytophagales bacterium]
MKLIATLTTMPSRIAYLEPVLLSILNQSMPPDEIHLQLPKHCLKEGCGYDLPDFIGKFSQVKVFEHDQDFGPATKWLPALAYLAGEEVMLLVMDDDCHYSTEMVANLYEFFQKDPHQVYCSTGGVLQGQKIRRFMVHEELQNNALTVIRNNKSPLAVDTVQGFSLILFNPNLVPKELIESLQNSALTQLADDIVLSAIFEKARINRIQIAPYQVPRPLDQAEINPIHGEGRLTFMSMNAFQWAQRALSVWETHEFDAEPKEPFIQSLKQRLAVFKKVIRRVKTW